MNQITPEPQNPPPAPVRSVRRMLLFFAIFCLAAIVSGLAYSQSETTLGAITTHTVY